MYNNDNIETQVWFFQDKSLALPVTFIVSDRY